eukprot:1701198-Pyramimonas_sp.AAC.1
MAPHCLARPGQHHPRNEGRHRATKESTPQLRGGALESPRTAERREPLANPALKLGKYSYEAL